ncbi:MAG: ATP-binding cassette domain-containing protein [Defluviitaleaceae bacterium]|nr:ATP-binding cassette domain-containing protein [Defluviitaleaceae bacterium]
MLELRHIYKSFGEKIVFTNLNLDFPEGKFTAVMGPSGCGKTTLINLILGILTPEHGEIVGFGGRKVAAVFQEDRLLEHKSGLENVLFVLRDEAKGRDVAEKLLERAELAQDAHKKAKEYSGGMRRRLALCRALVTDFDLLILDEPFKGMDAALKPRIMEMVKEKCAGKTVLLITHDRDEADFFDGDVVDISNLPMR